MYYIQRDGQRIRETVDEFATRKEALEMLHEYRISGSSAHYWISQRPCKDWHEAS